ncbi:MAG: hypothetical protein ACE14M_15690 [Terriglobales bacterium]
MAVLVQHHRESCGFQKQQGCLLRYVVRRQLRKSHAYVSTGLVDGGGVRSEKQLLPEFFGSPVRNGMNQCVQDCAPSNVVHDLDVFVLVQLRDHVSRRVEVVQDWILTGKCLEVDSGCLCA